MVIFMRQSVMRKNHIGTIKDVVRLRGQRSKQWSNIKFTGSQNFVYPDSKFIIN